MILSEHEPQGGALDGRCPWYVERAEDRTVLESLCRREPCFVLTSHQMGKTSLMVRLLARLRERGVAAAAIDLAALGRDADPVRWHDTVCLEIGQRLGMEQAVETFLAASGDGSPIGRCQAAFEGVILPRCASGLVLLIDELNILRSLPFDTDPFLGMMARFGAAGGGLTPCCFSALPRAMLVRSPRWEEAEQDALVVLEDFRPWELLAIVEPLARCVAEHRPEVGVLGVEWIACLLAWQLQRVYYWTHGHPHFTQRLASRALNEWIGLAGPSPGVEAEDVNGLVDRLAGVLFFQKAAALRDPNLALVRDRMPASVGVGGAEPARSCGPGRGLEPWLERLLQLGVLRVEGGTVRWRNRIYERVFSSEAWAKRLVAGGADGFGSFRVSGERGSSDRFGPHGGRELALA